MSSKEIKKILKPLIRECIKECLFEEGVLSGIIKEVVSGTQNVVSESTSLQNNVVSENLFKQKQLEEEYETERQKRIKRLNETMSKNYGGADIFEGVTPAAPEVSSASAHGSSPLAGIAPGDKGVDISGIVGLAKGKWKDLI